MLRNILLPATIRIPYVFLNEVLSLNAQEFGVLREGTAVHVSSMKS